MILQLALLLLPCAFSQFAPMGLQPDVAFGDQNDRFDLSAIFKPPKHKLRSDWRRQFQPMGLQPDVAFGDQNDRFDLASLQHHNKHQFRSHDGFRRQFQPMGLQPDVAFGDQNDRFDLAALQQHNKHQFRGHDGFRRYLANYVRVSYRRSINPDQPKGLFRMSAPNWRRVPLDDDWLEDMNNIAEDGRADGAVMLNRAQDYRRHHHPLRLKVPEESMTDRETRPKYAPPVKIRLQDKANGTFIFNFNV